MAFMTRTRQKRRPFSVAEWCGITCLPISFFLWIFSPPLAAVLLSGFVFLCLISPFFPGSSFFFPVISRGSPLEPAVCLTFDDGPNPQSTPPLLDLLDRYQVPAVFFVTGEHAKQHPQLIQRIVSSGHSVGNHSHTHDNYIMFRNSTRILWEIEIAQQVFQELGINVKVFRPPVGILTSRYTEALFQSGLKVITFSRRARDMGNRRIHQMARKILNHVQAGDIILLHDIAPRKETDLARWLKEIESILIGIQQQGIHIVPLAQLTETTVMELQHPSLPCCNS
jgi:peptidoglycan-N-acetylglucosamine deacetylase